MSFKFKVVSTGQRVGNLTAEPMLTVTPKSNRFKLNLNASKAIDVTAESGVTVLADVESELFAIYKAEQRVDGKGEPPMTKDVKMSEERKEELTEADEPIPQEPIYVNGCKLGKHLEFGSSNAIAQTGLVDAIDCPLTEMIDGAEIGIAEGVKVAVFSYAKDSVSISDDEVGTVEEVLGEE